MLQAALENELIS